MDSLYGPREAAILYENGSTAVLQINDDKELKPRTVLKVLPENTEGHVESILFSDDNRYLIIIHHYLEAQEFDD